jgi:YcaO-like protein with predicted kinase domain
MESLELYHAEHILSPLKLATYDDLRTNHRVVDVFRLPSVKNSRFHSNLQTLWIEGRDLTDGHSTWLPYECVHASASSPAPTGSGCFSSTSNGLASGNHMLEAILHGICEVVERDAVTVWGLSSQGNRNRSRLDLNSVDDASSRDVINRCEKAGNAVAVWDTTSDVGLPVFLCRIVERENESVYSSRSFSGMGCHTSREIALLRALTEAAQSRLTYISGSRDDLYRHEYESVPDSDAVLLAEVLTVPQVQLRDYQDVPSYNHDSFDEDIRAAVERLSATGSESVIAVDLTRPEFGIPVVRIVVPGLEGPDGEPEYVPGERARARRGQL